MAKYPKVNYIGNKEKLADWICDEMPVKNGTVLDMFAGGCSVSYALKQRGYSVIANDILFVESMTVYHRLICYACHMPWKGLVASHIKPLAVCVKQQKMQEAYDKNNGLLLSPNVDAYFDKFDISFDDKGSILLGKSIPDEIKEIMKDYKLDQTVLNEERKKYLQYHRHIFHEKNMQTYDGERSDAIR